MTKERKIEILKDLLVQLSDSANILCTCEADERCEVIEEYIEALEQQPSDETIKYLECNDIDVQEFIKAMKRQPLQMIKPNICDDCVSRQAVIDLVNAECVDLQDGSELWRSCVNDTVESIYHGVKDLPPVTPTQNKEQQK